mgnify:CR=1 FL=1
MVLLAALTALPLVAAPAQDGPTDEQLAGGGSSHRGCSPVPEAFLGGDALERIRHRIMTGLVRDAEGGDPERVEILAPALDRYAAVPGRSLEHATWAALTSARMRLSLQCRS